MNPASDRPAQGIALGARKPGDVSCAWGRWERFPGTLEHCEIW